MEYVLTPHNEQNELFAWWEGAFVESELNFLQNEARNSHINAKVGGSVDGLEIPSIRRSNINWMFNNSETKWVFEKLAYIVSTLNAQFFHFNLTGFGEPLQLTNYSDSDKGMYDWHVDMASHRGSHISPCRKLSLVMQLSDPVDYEGGVLELQPNSRHAIKMRKQRGLIIVFPSWTLHQVTPVTQGNRQSLVSWISGPSFK